MKNGEGKSWSQSLVILKPFFSQSCLGGLCALQLLLGERQQVKTMRHRAILKAEASLPFSPAVTDRSFATGCCSYFWTLLALDDKASSFWILDILGIFKLEKFSSPRLSYWQCCVFPAEQQVFLAWGFKPMYLLSVELCFPAVYGFILLHCNQGSPQDASACSSPQPACTGIRASPLTEVVQCHSAEGKRTWWLMSWCSDRCVMCIDWYNSLLNSPALCTSTRSESITTLMTASLLKDFLIFLCSLTSKTDLFKLVL